MLPTEDGQSVIFDSGYDKYGQYEVYYLYENIENEKIRFLFEENELLRIYCESYGSRGLFVDTNNRMFIRRFLSL